MADIQGLPAQIIILIEAAQDRIRKALEEESVEKVRDLLFEIRDCLRTMTEIASAAVSSEDNHKSA
jgi:hypothetical protein